MPRQPIYIGIESPLTAIDTYKIGVHRTVWQVSKRVREQQYKTRHNGNQQIHRYHTHTHQTTTYLAFIIDCLSCFCLRFHWRKATRLNCFRTFVCTSSADSKNGEYVHGGETMTTMAMDREVEEIRKRIKSDLKTIELN